MVRDAAAVDDNTVAALQLAAVPIVATLAAVKLSGIERTSPLQSDVSNAPWNMVLPTVVRFLFETALFAILRADDAARLKMLSKAFNVARALLDK